MSLDGFACICKYRCLKHGAGERMLSYGAVLIGTGVNALACAAHLGQKGWRVGVFEAAATPGGAVKTAAVTLPGFHHDIAAMNLSLFAGSATAFPDGRWLGVFDRSGGDPGAESPGSRPATPRPGSGWSARSRRGRPRSSSSSAGR